MTFQDARINITLSASVKALKDQAKDFIDRVASDLLLIDTQEHKAEILVEYKKTLNASQAITTVSNRHKEIEQEQAKVAEVERSSEGAPKEEIKPTTDNIDDFSFFFLRNQNEW